MRYARRSFRGRPRRRRITLRGRYRMRRGYGNRRRTYRPISRRIGFRM